MRIIKFRVWDKRKNYFNNDYSINGDSVYGYCEGGHIPKDEQSKLVFMQYTGLHDCHGKEIYEGDVMSSGKVVWSEFSCAFFLEGKDFKHTINYARDNFEVVGNIYESKNLIDNTDTKV